MKKALILFFNGLLSRKFLLFVVGTILLLHQIIDANQWLIIAGIYVGANIIESGVNKYINKPIEPRENK